jgi:hypothetical protein
MTAWGQTDALPPVCDTDIAIGSFVPNSDITDRMGPRDFSEC